MYKKTLQHLLSSIAAGAMLLTSCETGNEGGEITPPAPTIFEGTYTPYITDPQYNIGAFAIDATWKDPNNIPTIDLIEFGAEKIPYNTLIDTSNMMISEMYENGLAELTFNADKTFNGKYHRIIDLAELEFSKETYPLFDNTPESIFLASTLKYYTHEGKLYFSISRTLLDILSTEAGASITSIIDSTLKQYPNLGIVVDNNSYSIPFKYTLGNDNTLTIYVDREMMLPYLPLFEMLINQYIPEDITSDNGDKFHIRAMLLEAFNNLFDQTTALTISMKMQRK